MAPKPDQSEREAKIKEEKVHDVHWQLSNVSMHFAAKLIGAELKMPSVIPRRYQNAGVCPPAPVMLVVLPEAASTTYALTIMSDSRGINILNAKLAFKGNSGVLAWVEPYTGRVMDYFKSNKLGISELTDPKAKFTLPSANLHSAVSQVVAGFEQLVLSGSYHGGFSFENTYYVMAEGTGALTVKLCNFIEKGGPTKNKIAQDWYALKNELVKIRKMAVKLKDVWVGLDCCQLDGLIDVLGKIAPGNAESAFEEIRRQPFFWGRSERKDFFIADIPFALAKDDFFSKVKNATFINLPWSRKWDGLLGQMNEYRSTKNKKAYDISKRTHFVKFISGLYTHEDELELPVSVDVALLSIDPALCYRLYALLHNIITIDT